VYDNAETPFKRSSFEIGPEVFSHEYEEFMGSEIVMKEEGNFYGIVLNYYSHPWVPASPEDSVTSSKWMRGFESEFAFGQVDYDGQLQDGTPYTISDLDDFLIDARFLAGLDFPTADRLNTPYIGIGYRYLRDDSSSDPFGYLRQSNYLYLPIGLKMDSYKKNGWSIGASGEFDLLLFGMQISEIGGVDFTNNQTSGYGFRVAVDIKNRSNKSSLKIQPFVRYWHIDESDTDNETGVLFVEPENKTTQVGVQLAWEF
jgi:hypothetical protein